MKCKDKDLVIVKLMTLLQLTNDYILWLNDKNAGPVTMAYVHGWRCPEEDVKEGERRRSELESLKQEIDKIINKK